MRLRISAFFFCAIGLSLAATSVSAQSTATLPKGYYIVVASYLSGQEKFAKKYSVELNKSGRHSSYGFDAARNYYYVYLDFYIDFSTSIDRMLNTRKEDGFGEAWVRIIKDGIEQPAAVVVKNEEPKPQAVKTEEVVTKPEVTTTEAKKDELSKEQVVNGPTPIATEVVENPKADPVYIPQTLKNTQAFFSLYNAANGLVLDGEVEVIDTDRARLLSKMKANTYLTLPDPKSKSGKLTLIGSAFGFRKIQHEMNYYNTEADTLQEDIDLIGNFYMIKFDLSRMVKGDIATLYNVYFYNDAAVMLPESKYELNKLLQMMQDSPGYRIMLHGHTNGNGRGKIIYMGPEKDFFNITKDDVVNESGSAKELSGARANVIKEWLVAQGVAASRIQTKAWGGVRMLHDKDSQHARRNVRVEVEVLEN
ncbi:MAG: OmpA family protein [Cyclobacteriaceae bacterium]|nr:OmpA family protein [Cyclobacteriaceae bacterium]